MSPSTLDMESGAETQEVVSNSNQITQIVSFRLANEEYGVPIAYVQEIILIGKITPLPEVPAYLRGLINLRGHVIPVINLRARFGIKQPGGTEQSRIIVVNVGQKTVGIIVDAVSEILRINGDQVEPAAAAIGSVGRRYLAGLVKFEDRLLILLDIKDVVKEEAL